MAFNKKLLADMEQKEKNFWNNLFILEQYYCQGRLKRKLARLREEADQAFAFFKYHATSSQSTMAGYTAFPWQVRKAQALMSLEPLLLLEIKENTPQEIHLLKLKAQYFSILERAPLNRAGLKMIRNRRIALLGAHFEPLHQQGIVSVHQPFRLFFDKRRAYDLLHQESVADVVGKGVELQRRCLYQKPFVAEQFHRCREAASPTEAFQQLAEKHFHLSYQLWVKLCQEQKRICKKTPGKTSTFFFPKTKRACLCWEESLYVKQAEVLDIDTKRFKELVEAFYHWISQLLLAETLSAEEFQEFMQVLEAVGTDINVRLLRLNQESKAFFEANQLNLVTQNKAHCESLLTSVNRTMSQVSEKLTRLKANRRGLVRESPPSSPTASRSASGTTTPIPSAIFGTTDRLEKLAEGIPLSQGNFEKLMLELNRVHLDASSWQAYLVRHQAALRGMKERLNKTLHSEQLFSEIPYVDQSMQFFLMLAHNESLYDLKKELQGLYAHLHTQAEQIPCHYFEKVETWLSRIGNTNVEQLHQLRLECRALDQQIAQHQVKLQAWIQEIAAMSPIFSRSLPQVQALVEESIRRLIRHQEDFNLFNDNTSHRASQATFLNILTALLQTLHIQPEAFFDPIFHLSLLCEKSRNLHRFHKIAQSEMSKLPEKYLTHESLQRIHEELYLTEAQAASSRLSMSPS